MEIHNMAEDWIVCEVNSLCDSIEKDSSDTSLCTCAQCRQDAICYVLNRTEPRYVVSHRGIARANQDRFDSQQNRVDLTALVYEGIRRVSHNQRPYADHHGRDHAAVLGGTKAPNPVFNIPIIMGRVFSGLNFSPVMESTVHLLQNGNLVSMRDANWQNPYDLIPNTSGTFTFWPGPVNAEKSGAAGVFQYVIRILGGDFEELSFSFAVPAVSEESVFPLSMTKTFKLPDLYLFPPGEEKAQLIINE
ncbi:MAG: late competence development ComFB family protein [Treponema sp.]|nr:late competence development ComFB family protein [Treponema sp.]